MADATDGKAPQDPRRRRIVAIGAASLGIVILLVAAIGIAIDGSDATPASLSESNAPEPTVTSTPTPTPVPSSSEPIPTPDDSPRPLPTDCRAIYTQAFLDTYAEVELNMPEVMSTGTSRFPEVEAIRQELPGLRCYWGGPTEGGLQTAVNALPANQLADTIDTIKAAGATCAEWNVGTLCNYSEVLEPTDADPARWTIAEQYYFRDGWWITTWQANTGRSIDEDTMPLYETLWP